MKPFMQMTLGKIGNKYCDFKTNYRYGLLYEVMKWISVDIGDNAVFPRLERRQMPKQGYCGIQDGDTLPINLGLIRLHQSTQDVQH